jgi:DNA-binding transcriptional regulator YhcF (GntR family)
VTIANLPTHAEFAARIGTHREAVTREFGTLKDEGVVAQSGRTLIVHSVRKLEALSARFLA